MSDLSLGPTERTRSARLRCFLGKSLFFRSDVLRPEKSLASTVSPCVQNDRVLPVDYSSFEKTLTAAYRQAAGRYRRDDELEIQTENHRRLCGNLGRISAAFDRKIAVLDAGCGTGRHFHCLRNVATLTGVDISAEMLRAAEKPVRNEHLDFQEIRLVRSNIYDLSYPAGSFDFIYSLGVFGHGAQFTKELCRKFHHWLSDDGRLYVNTIERSEDPPLVAGRKKIKNAIYPLLPRRIQQHLDERNRRLPVFTMAHDELEEIMHGGGFLNFNLSANVCRSPLWTGVHLECLAIKTPRLRS